MTGKPHARAFDLPGWPCPPRVRDIPHREDSWGWIGVGGVYRPAPVAQDELGYLWVNGNITPQFRTPTEGDGNPGAITFFDKQGIGLWIHPKSHRFLPSISRLDMDPDEWLPVNVTPDELPTFVKERA